MTTSTPDAEVVDICRALIRIDTSNFGDDSGPGEREAAEYVVGLLDEVGVATSVFESEPRRTTAVARLPGSDPTRTDALLVHGHLDVVPAMGKDWRYDPFGAEVAEGYVWGRGAIDMKDMDAMILSVVRDRVRTGRPPARPVVLCFLADEEAGGTLGSKYVVREHPELFEGCTEGISEVGGFSLSFRDHAGADRRAYLVQAAEKGMAWMKVAAEGPAGHGSLPHPANAVAELARALARVADHEWPLLMTPTLHEFFRRMSDALGVELDPADLPTLQQHFGSLARVVQATTRHVSNPTVLRAGYKTNVVPSRAEAEIDGRFLPGHQDEFLAQIDALLGPRVHRYDTFLDIALETPFEGSTVDAMGAALLAEDPGALVVPYTLFGGTDAKAFSRLGIVGYGFSPLRLGPELDFPAMFHGVDERVPVDGLRFGARVLDRFLDLC